MELIQIAIWYGILTAVFLVAGGVLTAVRKTRPVGRVMLSVGVAALSVLATAGTALFLQLSGLSMPLFVLLFAFSAFFTASLFALIWGAWREGLTGTVLTIGMVACAILAAVYVIFS